MTNRLTLASGSTFSIGAGSSATTVFGTDGVQNLTIAAGASVTLDASFNKGGDTITLAGNASSYTVTKSGSSVILTDATGSITIPVGVVGMNIAFADAAARSLVSTTAGAFTLGSQAVSETAAAVTAGTVATAGSTFTLTTGVDTGAAFTGTARNDTFNASQATLNPGDSLVGGDGTDTLQITSVNAAATLGGDALVSGIEVVNTTATVAAATVTLGTFTGVTTVGSSGSTAGVSYINVQSIPVVNVSGTSANVDVSVAAAAVAGLADAATINLTSVGSTASNSVTINGVEAITVNTTGNIGATQIDGVTINRTTIASTTLNSVTVNGSGSANLAVSLAGAPVGATATPGVFTGSAGADDVVLTIPAGSRLTANLGTGNDTLRLSAAAAAMTINGGDGTDTLVYSGASAAATATANITGFENVVMGAGVDFAVATSNLTYAVAAGGTYTGLAAGGTVALTAGGTLTLANAALTGTTDAVTVTVGTAAATAPTAATIAAGTFDVVTVNGVARSDTLASTSAAISVSGTTLNTVTLNSSQGVALAGGGAALTTINASGVAGNFSSTATTSATAGLTITTGAGNDVINGGALGDSLNGGAGNDTITGGVGRDTMTGGTGADRFVFAANAADALVSSATAIDTITDFTSGTDKLEIAGATSFLGNFVNIQAALAAQGAPGVAAGSAAFVSGENSLYVFANTNGTLAVLDRIIRLEGVTALSGADLLLGAQGTGATITTTASTAPVINTVASNAVSATATTNFDDTITAAAATSLVGTGAAINGGLGVDTLNATIAVASLATLDLTTADAIATGDTAGGVALTGVEVLNLTISDIAGGTVTVNAVPTSLTTLVVNGANSALAATVTAAGQTLTVNNSTLGGNASTFTFGAVASQTANGGTANDVFNTIADDGITANGNAGNDVFNITNVAAFDNDTGAADPTPLLVINGGAGTDSIVFAAGLTGTINLLDTDDISITAVETLDVGTVAAGGMAVTLSSGFTTLQGNTTNGNITFNATAARIGALTTITSAAAGNVFSVATTDTAAVTVDLSAITFTTLANVDSITFASAAGATVTVDENVAVTGTAATTDIYNLTANLTAAGAVTLATTGFEVINVSAAQTVNALTMSASAVTLNASASGAYVAGAATATMTGSAAAAVAFTDAAGTQTIGHTGTGTLAVTLVNDTAAADTVTVTGTGAVTVNQVQAAGVTTINLNATNGAVDTINLGGTGIVAATDRVVINGFNATADKIGLDIDNTTAGGAAGTVVVGQVVAAAGAVTFDTANNDVLVLNFDLGGAADVIGTDLTGANLLANLGGALSVAATAGAGYIVAYDAGNAYLFRVAEAAGDGDATVAAADIVLLGLINGVAVGSVTATDFLLIA
jgi:trimeric autotransporter adhesin